MNTFPTFMQAYGSFCNRWSLCPLGNCLDIHNWYENKAKDVGFNICKNLKITFYSQFNLASYLKACTIFPTFHGTLNGADKLVFLLSNYDVIFFNVKICCKMLSIRTDVSKK